MKKYKIDKKLRTQALSFINQKNEKITKTDSRIDYIKFKENI